MNPTLFLLRAIRAWRLRRTRWPLTRQIAVIFAALMVVNGLVISTALDYWTKYRVTTALAKTTPQAQEAYRRLEQGASMPTPAELALLQKELFPLLKELDKGVDTALYVLIALGGVVTFGSGYLILGRLGLGLRSAAFAARNIANGDLTVRATMAGFSSREEAQLIGDFNRMAVALQRAERELAENTASIAHELRTPLTILRGRLHGIADGVFALEATEVQGLLFQVEGLGRLVEDLQTLSLADSQRLVLELEEIDLGDEVKKVLASMGPDLVTAGLDTVLSLQTALVLADGARVRQVISAIFSNACRYAPQSGILRIATQSDHDGSILEIVDHGPGLPDGSEVVAFNRFWRGETSRSRNSGGTGLGLSVVRAIVEAHGGKATLSNHLGGGALFEMHLPKGAK